MGDEVLKTIKEIFWVYKLKGDRTPEKISPFADQARGLYDMSLDYYTLYPVNPKVTRIIISPRGPVNEPL